MKQALMAMVMIVAAAPAVAQKFSYDYVELGAEQREYTIDDNTFEFDSVSFGYTTDYQGRLLLGIRAYGAEADIDQKDPLFSDGQLSDEILGVRTFIGGASQVAPDASVHMALGVGVSEMTIKQDTPFPGGLMLRKDEEVDTAEYFLSFGGRQWLLPGFEVNGEIRIEHVDMDFFGNDTFYTARVGLRYQPVEQFSIGGYYEADFGDDTEAVGASIRWMPGR